MKACVLACTLWVSILPHLADAAEEPPKSAQTSPDVISGPPLAETPNFPYGYDVIQGNPPDGRIKRWIRYVIMGQHNHPFPIVFFSPQIFKPKTALESLIVLSDAEYKSLSAFTGTQPCTKQRLWPASDQWSGGEITEHQGTKAIHCALLLIDACNYLSGLMELPDIKWTPAQLKLIHGLGLETNCEAKHLVSADNDQFAAKLEGARPVLWKEYAPLSRDFVGCIAGSEPRLTRPVCAQLNERRGRMLFDALKQAVWLNIMSVQGPKFCAEHATKVVVDQNAIEGGTIAASMIDLQLHGGAGPYGADLPQTYLGKIVYDSLIKNSPCKQ